MHSVALITGASRGLGSVLAPGMSNFIKRSGRGMSHYLFFCLSRASWYLLEMSAWLSRCSSFHHALM